MRNATPKPTRWKVALSLATLLGGTLHPMHGHPGGADHAIVAGPRTMELVANQASIVKLRETPWKIEVDDPACVTAVLVAPMELSMVGRGEGRALITLHFRAHEQRMAIHVSSDPADQSFRRMPRN